MVKGYGKGNFASDRQRKKIMSELNPSKPSKKILPDDLFPHQLVLDGLAWSGCLTMPQYCNIITSINEAYKKYKQLDELNFKEILKIASLVIINLSKHQINGYSDIMILQFEQSKILDYISNETKIDKDTFKNIMKGTISNSLTKGIETMTEFIINKTI